MSIIQGMSPEERQELMQQLKQKEKEDSINRRDAYEALRAEFVMDVRSKLMPLVGDVKNFRTWIEEESATFNAVMREYGKLRKSEQESYTIVDGDFKLEVKSNKIKGFDERADLAAERLVDYLKRYVQTTQKGTDDPIYQLAMTLLERNKMGDLDYKSISKLYELEGRFDAQYVDIMNLFRESNVITKTAVNYYFSHKDKNGVWRKIEPSFCRL